MVGATAQRWGLGFTEDDPADVRARLDLNLPEDGGSPTALIEGLLQLSDASHLLLLTPSELVEVAAAFTAIEAWAGAGARAVGSRLHTLHGREDADPPVAGRVERGGAAADDLAMRLGVSRRRAARLVGEGRLYEGVLHPVGEALASGRIDAGKAAVIAELLVDQPPAVCFAVTEQVLPEAPGLTHHALRQRVRAVIVQVDPGTASERLVTAAAGRRLEGPRLLADGMASLRLVAPALDVATVCTAADVAARAARAAGDSRTLEQLRADAVATLAGEALASGDLSVVPAAADLLVPEAVRAAGAGEVRRPDAGTILTPTGPGADLFGDLRAGDASEGPAAQVRRTLRRAQQGLSVATRRRLGVDRGSAYASATADELRAGPRRPGAPPGGWRDQGFVPFSSSTSRLTLAVAPDHLAPPCPGAVHPADPWWHDLAASTDDIPAGFQGYEAPSACRLGIDVPALLGVGPIDPETARRIAADPPRWLTVSTAVAEVAVAAEDERTSSAQQERAGRGLRDGRGQTARSTEPGRSEELSTEALVAEGADVVPLPATPGCDTLRYWPAGFDPAPHLATTGYAPGTELAQLVRTLHPTCVAPSCTVASSACDNDHVVPWPLGPTSAANLRPLCRRHHNLKTTGRHRYRITLDGSALWTTGTGHVYLRPPGQASRLLSAPPPRGAGAAGARRSGDSGPAA